MKLKESTHQDDPFTITLRTQNGGQMAGHGYREITVELGNLSMTVKGYRSQHKAILAMKACLELAYADV